METASALPPAQVDIWRIYLPTQHPVQLTGAELERASRFHFETDRRHWSRARSALRTILSRYTGLAPLDLAFQIGEHGKYPTNARGQILYPRRRFFEEVCKVFEASKKSVPVFNDKHLAAEWKDAKWMYDRARELFVPFLAGSSVPVT